MKVAALTKAALCVCPPVIVATTAVTVPPVRRAVHHLTAPHHPHVAHRPHHRILAQTPCGAGGSAGGGGPAALRTFADAGPNDSVIGPASAFASPFVPISLPNPVDGMPGDYRAPIGVGTSTPGGIVPAIAGGSVPGIVPTTGTGDTGGQPVAPGVPEPTTWTLMLAGIGGIGIMLRGTRRERRFAPGSVRGGRGLARSGSGRSGLARSGLAFAGVSMDVAGTLPIGYFGAAASTASTGAKSTKAALLAKAILCVCPPVLLATSVATVPPLRHAVYAATAPHERARSVATALPCGSDVAGATIVPVVRSADADAFVSVQGSMPPVRTAGDGAISAATPDDAPASARLSVRRTARRS